MMGPRIWGYGMEFLIELPSNDISGGLASGFSENAEASSVDWSQRATPVIRRHDANLAASLGYRSAWQGSVLNCCPG